MGLFLLSSLQNRLEYPPDMNEHTIQPMPQMLQEFPHDPSHHPIIHFNPHFHHENLIHVPPNGGQLSYFAHAPSFPPPTDIMIPPGLETAEVSEYAHHSHEQQHTYTAPNSNESPSEEDLYSYNGARLLRRK